MNEEPAPPPARRHAVWNIFGNPLFRRYCRSRLRARGLGVSLLIVMLLAGFIVAMTRAIGIGTGIATVDAARAAIIPLLVLQSLLLFVLGTAQVAGGMTAERDEGVIDYQRLIPMTPFSKVLGYLFGLPVREYAMFLATLPFAAWALLRGGVPWTVWLPLYLVVLTSTLTYHFTGLLTGTVVRNRRWAFLVSIGLVFCLYTVVPQMAKFGLVFFKYLTIGPVFEEALPDLLPRTAGAVVRTGQRLAPTVKFFNLDFSEAVFTVFSQAALIVTFAVMLRRRWRRAESLLLGKPWAAGFFIWIQVLLLGNALPLIDPGNLFPSRAFARMTRIAPNWRPEPAEAVVMCGIYGLVTLMLLCILAVLITPGVDHQVRGWRRARKHGRRSLPVFSDAASGSGYTLVMALAGAAGWFLFSRALVGSRWFPGHELPWSSFAYFFAVMAAAGLAFQTLLETKGSRPVFLAVILIGIVPVMTGAVLSAASTRLLPAATWITGMSPLSLPVYAAGSLLPISEPPVEIARAIPRAFHFWLVSATLTMAWLALRLRASRKAIAERASCGGLET